MLFRSVSQSRYGQAKQAILQKLQEEYKRGYNDAKNHKYTKGKTIETYRLRNGAKINLPIYYRNQLFSEEEREMLFLDKIEKGIIYVMGQKVHRNNEAEYLGLLEEARKTEQRLYGVHEQDWEQQKYINS